MKIKHYNKNKILCYNYNCINFAAHEIDGQAHSMYLCHECLIQLKNSIMSITSKDRTVKGCYYNKANKKWRAKIVHNKVIHNLGYYDTQEEASKAYFKEKERLKKLS